MVDCPAGSYCPEGSHRPIECPAGFYCPLNTATFRDFPCPDGQYGNAYYSAKATGLQAPGDCIVCPAGYFCKGHDVTPVRCPVGTYMPETTANMADLSTVSARTDKACLKCTAGSACPTEGMAAPITCLKGTYSPESSSQCFPCKAGRLCNKDGMTATEYYSTAAQCPEGQWCPENATASTPCPEGYYCPAATPRPQECPAGTYGATTGLKAVSECTTTSAGHFTARRASLAREATAGQCDVGHFCVAGSNSFQNAACPKGTY